MKCGSKACCPHYRRIFDDCLLDDGSCTLQVGEAPKNPTPFGLLERLVKWLKADFEMTMYRVRPLRYCKGHGCYVQTPGRKDGVPYCLACREENNSLAT
ncbi:MAG: hypothetical protein KAR40_13765 [Candidatus Sabulitectum sp.]|nr:hypothetical protein [Candidatus Sabulitectum sp.]